MEILILILIAYLIGSIPFGVILGKLAGIGDIRKVGSGNIGATNMLRAGGKKLALITLLLDMSKGLLCPLLIYTFMSASLSFVEESQGGGVRLVIWFISVLALYISGLGVLLGHCYPVWLKFKGGKGVATLIGYYLGFLFFGDIGTSLFYFALSPLIIWLLSFLIIGISSVSGMLAALAPAIYVTFDHSSLDSFVDIPLLPVGVYWLMALLVIFKHRENIHRLMKGEEPKVRFGK